MNRLLRLVGILLTIAVVSPYARADSAIAVDGNDVIYWSSKKTLKQARAEVIAYCKKNSSIGKCKQISESRPNTSGFGAAAQSKTRIGFAVGYRTQDEASGGALRSCVRDTPSDDVCKITLEFRDDANDTPASKEPAGAGISYMDKCFNGDCVRTFESGKKVRFQAPYCFSPSKGRWDWEPNGC